MSLEHVSLMLVFVEIELQTVNMIYIYTTFYCSFDIVGLVCYQNHKKELGSHIN